MNRNITALILIVLGIGIYFTYTAGIIDEAKKVKVANDKYISAIENAKQLLSVRDTVMEKYNAISPADVARLDKMIPSTVDNIRLIIDLNELGKKNNLSLKNVKAVASKSSAAAAVTPSNSKSLTIAAPTQDVVNVSFNVTTSYQQFISFLQILESNLRLMDVTHLSVTSSDTGQYEFSVDLKTYWLRQ